jgi:hypothetical protein
MTEPETPFVISLRLPLDVAERAKHQAKSEDRSLSALIRVALVAYLDSR